MCVLTPEREQTGEVVTRVAIKAPHSYCAVMHQRRVRIPMVFPAQRLYVRCFSGTREKHPIPATYSTYLSHSRGVPARLYNPHTRQRWLCNMHKCSRSTHVSKADCYRTKFVPKGYVSYHYTDAEAQRPSWGGPAGHGLLLQHKSKKNKCHMFVFFST